MRYINQTLFFLFTILLSSCGAPAVPTIVPAPTAKATQTIPPPVQASPTAETTPALEAGQWAYLFYHEERAQVVMVNGGPEQGKPADEPLELWGWDGAQWSLIAADASGPTWRNWAAVAYDTARDVLVVHGGEQSRKHFEETWEWDGQTWELVSETAARAGAVMAYDPARQKIVLFGGSDAAMQIHGGTWEWDGQQWTLVSETGPAPRFPAGMVFDPAIGQVLMYSGHFAEQNGGSIDYDDLWAWDGSAWHEIAPEGPTPGHRTHAGFVYDPVAEKVLLIGSGNGTFLSDMWSWDGARWEEIPTSGIPARSGLNVAYDPNRDRLVLFGGVDRPGGIALDDTWEWDRVKWSCVHNCR